MNPSSRRTCPQCGHTPPWLAHLRDRQRRQAARQATNDATVLARQILATIPPDPPHVIAARRRALTESPTPRRTPTNPQEVTTT